MTRNWRKLKRITEQVNKVIVTCFFKNMNQGELLTGEIKQKCIACLQELTKEHQERRALATAEKVQDYWAVRKLKYDYPDPPKSKRTGLP